MHAADEKQAWPEANGTNAQALPTQAAVKLQQPTLRSAFVTVLTFCGWVLLGTPPFLGLLVLGFVASTKYHHPDSDFSERSTALKFQLVLWETVVNQIFGAALLTWLLFVNTVGWNRARHVGRIYAAVFGVWHSIVGLLVAAGIPPVVSTIFLLGDSIIVIVWACWYVLGQGNSASESASVSSDLDVLTANVGASADAPTKLARCQRLWLGFLLAVPVLLSYIIFVMFNGIPSFTPLSNFLGLLQ